MSNESNKLHLLSSKLIKFLLGGLLIGLPLSTALEVKADMQDESMEQDR